VTKGKTKPQRGGIKIGDTEAIKAQLDKVNCRATSFVLTPSALKSLTENAEARLDAARLPQAMRVGIVLRYRTAGTWAKAYKYSATGNMAELKRCREGWRLQTIDKIAVYPRQKANFTLLIDEHCAAEIKRRSVEDFEVLRAKQSAGIPVGETIEAATMACDDEAKIYHDYVSPMGVGSQSRHAA
jgi:hypothetical protein